MSFNYKNPITPLISLGNQSVPRTSVYGTNFSILGTGGYMEVYSVNDLYFTIPSSYTGLIEFSANTIPIQFNKGIGSIFSPDVLTLNSDNISSGRRRIGMLVYVIDEDQIYQYQIPNFELLWSGATGATGPGGNTVVFSEFGTTIKSNSPEGIAFISAWTSNTIEGVSGGTSSNSVWKKLVTGGGGGSGAFTGGTVTGDTFFTNGLTATTFSAGTYLGLPIDVYVTGSTYSNNTFTFTNNTGGTFNVSFNSVTGLTVNGDFSATTMYGDGSNITGINFSQLATTAHTHPISDVINLQNELDSKIDKPANPFLGDYLYYNGVAWVPNQVNIPVSAGAGITLFLSLTGSSLIGYEYLSQFPIEINEIQEPVVVNNNKVLIGKYATEQLGRTFVDPGIWEFNTYASVDIPSTGLTQIIVNVYLLTTGGTETFLFSSSTENITTTAATVYTFSVVEQQYSCNTTDYLVVNYSASTTNNFNTTVTLYHGGTLNYSHIHTPFITLHNDLAGIQGGFSNEHYHLSKNETDLLTTGLDASSIHNHDSSYLSLNGGIVSGDTVFTNGLTATTISATTYQNLPVTADTFVTGFTISANTITIKQNNNKPDLPATIPTVDLSSVLSGVSFNIATSGSFSASTYLGLPTDIRVTGGTYNSGTSTITFTNNTGGTFTVTGITAGGGGGVSGDYLPLSGGTVTGGTRFTAGLTGNSAVFSSSTQNVLNVVGSGSTSPIFRVQGSQGELFAVTDSLTGSLFSVNDISGLPIMEVFSDNTILMGSYFAPSLNTTYRLIVNSGLTNLYSIPVSAYTGAFYDYTVSDTSNARAGNIMTIFSGTSVQYTETSTLDIGSTTGVTFSVGISSGNAVLSVSATTNNWTVKTIIRSI